MKTILIVDDLESVRFYHRHLLQQAGFETLTAADGAEALRLLERHPVDLVILDLLMPHLGGAEFLERARAIPRYDGLPVLVITSEAPEAAAGRAPAPGACPTLQKPLAPDRLLAAVRQLLG